MTDEQVSTDAPRRRWRVSRRTLLLVAGTALATIALVLVFQASRRAFLAAGRGSLTLITPSPPVFAELVDGRGEVVERITVPNQLPREVPAGDYQLRAGGDGALGRVFGVSVSAGDFAALEVREDDRQLWRGVDGGRQQAVFPHSGGADLIVVDGVGVRRVGGASGEPVWSLDLAARRSELREAAPGLIWPDRQFSVDQNSWSRSERLLIAPPRDVNRDGAPDVLLGCLRQAWLMAIDGDRGEVLWIAARGSDVVLPSEPMLRDDSRYQLISAVVGGVDLADDLDGDGTGDVVAGFIDTGGDPFRGTSGQLKRWVEAISGADGRTLWRYDLPDKGFQLPQGIQVPRRFRWIVESGGYGSGGGGMMYASGRLTRDRTYAEPHGGHHYVPAAVRFVNLGGDAEKRPGVVVVAGRQIVSLDGKRGQVLSTSMLPGHPVGPVRVQDLDGDAVPECVVLDELPSARPASRPSPVRMTAWSLAKEARLWTRKLDAARPDAVKLEVPPPEWPLLEDLDGDGQYEVLVAGENPEVAGRSAAWGWLAVLEGDSGETRWTRQLFTCDQQIDFFAAGPDIDADGQREVYVATLWGHSMDVYVECLAGRDGSTLWRARRTMRLHERSPGNFRLAPLAWWNASGDGWPQLIVPVYEDNRQQPPSRLLFSAGSGQITGLGRALHAAYTLDVDADGLDELVTVHRPDTDTVELSCLRGVAADRFRWLGSRIRYSADEGHWQELADLDDDGTADLVQVNSAGVVRAMSTATGRLLWRRVVPELRRSQAVVIGSADTARQAGDLDVSGDGMADVLIAYSSTYGRDFAPLIALSGRDGRRLWTSELKVSRLAAEARLAVADFDEDGRSEVVLLAPTAPAGTRRFGGGQERVTLFVLAGRNGRIRWQQPLQLTKDPWSRPPSRDWFPTALLDCDGDGGLDIVVPAQPEDGSTKFELRAYDGRDGELKWKRALVADNRQRSFEDILPLARYDLQGDGRDELVVIDLDPGPQYTAVRLRVLNALDGAVHWEQEVPAESYLLSRYRRDLRPLVLSRRDAPAWFCVSLAPARQQLMIFDSQGKPLSAGSQAEGRRRSHERLRVWPCDADGDGNDELLVVDERTMALVRADDPATVIWQQPLEIRQYGVLDVRAARGEQPPTVVVRDSEKRAYVALRADDGRPLWSCPMTEDLRHYSETDPTRLVFNDRDPGQPPHLVLQGALETVCRQATSSDAARAGAAVFRPPPLLEPPPRDSRLRRQLPWNLYWENQNWGELAVVNLWSAFLSVTLLILPAAFLLRMIQLRRFGMRMLLAAPAVVALMVIVLQSDDPSSLRSLPPNKWLTALMALPVLLFLGVLAWAAVRRKRRLVLLLVAAPLVLSLVMAVLTLGAEIFANQPLQPGEYYELNGWYWVMLYGVYITGWLLVLILPITMLVLALGARGRRRG